jgi:hypothetical protein
MTLPELRIDADSPQSVTLHPRLTIVEGDPRLRAAVISAVAAAAEVDPAVVLEYGVVAPSELAARLAEEPVVPGSAGALDRAVADHEVAEADHDSVLGALDLATQRKLDLRTERTETKALLDGAIEARQRAAEVATPHDRTLELLAEATARVAPSAATVPVADAAEATADGGSVPTDGGVAISPAAAAVLRARLTLADHLEAIDVLDTRTIDQLRLDTIEALQVGLSPDEVATALLDAWGQLDATEAVATAVVQQAEDRVAEMQAAVDDAERGMRPGLIDPVDRRSIEAAHDDLLAAEESARKRFSSPGARRRREEARELEQRVLGRFGFHTYEDYVLANAVATVDTTAKQRLSESIEGLAVAEQELLWAMEQRRETRQQHESSRADIREWAASHLGDDPGDDVEAALRACTTLPALPEGFEDAVRAAARTGVEQRDLADAAVTELQESVARLDGELADLERRIRELRSRALQVVADLETRRRARTRAEELVAADEAAAEAAGLVPNRRGGRVRTASPAGMEMAIEYLTERLGALSDEARAHRVPLVLDDALSVMVPDALPPVLAWLAAAAKGRQVLCLVADLERTMRGFRLDPSSGNTGRLVPVPA